MAEKIRTIVPVEDLSRDPYRSLIAYPDPTPDALESRIGQLRDLGVTELEFCGPLSIGKLAVLGKGVVGIVFSGRAGDRPAAVKIRRVDSRRPNMNHEADMVKTANSAGIGPDFLGVSRDILMMQFVEGKSLPSWITSLRGRGTRARVRSTFKALFEQCVKLDAYGLDHGELSRAHKNVLVSDDDKPWILDFESASLMRRVNNFTSIAQYLLLSGRFSRKVERVLGAVEKDELVNYLREYKSGRTNYAFEAVQKMLRL
ncbi:serine/threonine protein kinase [Candidatus Bathyarchaeota archaeon]|nr:serine/threonine protein kinase [Candidatus Bathyarchaeota archaeon]